MSRLGFRHLHGGALERARGADGLADPRIAANKGDKSVEIIMNEILVVLTTACEQHNIDKLEFVSSFL